MGRLPSADPLGETERLGETKDTDPCFGMEHSPETIQVGLHRKH